MKYDKPIRLMFMFLMLFVMQEASAQPRTIDGFVTDEIGSPVEGASVRLIDSNIQTTTNGDGAFSLSVPISANVLQISFVGYETAQVAIDGGNSVNVQLVPSLQGLDEVVVVGYGTLNKKEVSSAITHVSSKDLLTVGGNGFMMSLQGKVAGLSITNTSTADPNSSFSVQLRGVSSRDAGLGPLYVINGVPGGNIDNVNQEDIESIDILKGGAASAIYGTRGSNGVVIITTKKWSSTSQLVYTGYSTLDFATDKLHVLSSDEFLQHERGVDHGSSTNWLKAVTRDPALAHKHTLQLAGGSEKTNYLISADYRDATGIDLRAEKEEYGSRLNLNHRSENGLYNVTLNIAPRMFKNKKADYNGFNYALTLNPTLSAYDEDGNYEYITSGFGASNPVESPNLNLSEAEYKYLDISGSFTLNPLKNLSSTVTIGQINRTARDYLFVPSTSTTVVNGTGRNRASQSLSDNDQKSFEWIGNYAFNTNNHSLGFLAGYSYQLFTSSGFNAANELFPSDALGYNNLGSGLWNLEDGINNVGSSKNDSKLIAFFGRVNYSFNSRYYLSASLRHEGSSKFGYNNKWGNFPAASVAWRLTEESFMESASWLDELKLRADYGVTGNQDFGSYLSLDTYRGWGYYPYNGVYYQVWGPNQNTNYNLHWEKAINFNIGADFELFHGALVGSVNYYIRENRDLLGNYRVQNPPNIVGETYANVGTMKNAGLELQLDVGAINRKDFTYRISFAGSTNENEFVSFSNDVYSGQEYVDAVNMPAPGSPGNIQRLQEGKRIGSFYMLKSAGYDEFGRLLVYNQNNDIISANSATNDDKRFVGNGLPRFTASLGNTFTFRNWDLSVFLRGAFGYDLFNTTAFYLGTPATQENINVLASAYDGGKYSKLTHPSTYSSLSDYFLEKGDFIKVDNITLGYETGFQSRLMKSMRLFFTGRNLFTLTNFTGGDPDLIQVNGLYPGVKNTLSYYPSTLQLLLGARITL